MKKKKINKNMLLLYGILLFSILLLIWSVYTTLQPKYGANYQRALQSELPDRCVTPHGYTNEEWGEHMSHHPDRYKECLEKLK